MGLKIEVSGNAIRYTVPTIDRAEKGKSIIACPENYTVVDVETTGYDFEYDSIIEISAVRVRNGVIQDKYISLVKPTKIYFLSDDGDYEEDEFIPLSEFEGYYYVDKYITDLTGITNEMLETAPEQNVVISEFVNFIGDDLLVAHNANFDINFLYDAIYNEVGTTLKNDFIDTLRIARKVFPSATHHRLSDVAEFCNVSYEGAHRALQDCNITYACFERMRTIIYEKYDSFDNFKKLFASKGGKKIDCSAIISETDDFDEEHPFYHKTVVFTGALQGIIRKEAMQSVVNVGGYIADSVTKATNYLIVGSFDYVKSVKGNKSSKMKKAEKMRLDGYDITIISENTFLEML